MRRVGSRRPAAVVPVRVALEMSPKQFARYEALWEQARKRSDIAADKVEALLEMMATFVEHSSREDSAKGRRDRESSTRADVELDNLPGSTRVDVVKPPVQIHVHLCPECAKATVPTSKGDLALSAAELDRARCDGRISIPGERNKASIPPAVRRLVLTHARHRCERPGCDHTRFLEVHHRIPRSRGGTNDPSNLMVVCSTCHALLHRRIPGTG